MAVRSHHIYGESGYQLPKLLRVRDNPVVPTEQLQQFEEHLVAPLIFFLFAHGLAI